MLLQMVFIESEQNHRAAGTHINSNYTSVIKSIEMASNTKVEQTENKENTEKRKSNPTKKKKT